jgi:hypothetical protein
MFRSSLSETLKVNISDNIGEKIYVYKEDIENKHNIYISFTTVPNRAKHIAEILNNLYLQLLFPIFKDKNVFIIVNYPKLLKKNNQEYPDLFKNNDFILIKRLLDDSNIKLIINDCEDYGAITKLYPTLKYCKNPDDIIITIDDDIYLNEDALSNLINYSEKYPHSVLTYHAAKIGSNIFTTALLKGVDKIVDVDIVCGSGLCLYRNYFFDNIDLLKYPKNNKHLIYHDDVWISGNLDLQNINRKYIPSFYKYITYKEYSHYGGLSNTFVYFMITFFKALSYFRKKGCFKGIEKRNNNKNKEINKDAIIYHLMRGNIKDVIKYIKDEKDDKDSILSIGFYFLTILIIIFFILLVFVKNKLFSVIYCVLLMIMFSIFKLYFFI